LSRESVILKLPKTNKSNLKKRLDKQLKINIWPKSSNESNINEYYQNFHFKIINKFSLVYQLNVQEVFDLLGD